MRALVYRAPGTIALEEVDAPGGLAADESLVRVGAVGICGSDMHAYLGHDERRPPPLVLGHEAAGNVDEGPGKGGDVVVNPLVTCGDCRHCRAGRTNLCREREIISMPPRQGAFAELLRMPARNLLPKPASLGTAQAALAEPLACGHHARRLAQEHARQPLRDSTCMVLGGGAIGVASALHLLAAGARKVAVGERNPLRHRALASTRGAECFVPGEDGEPPPSSVDVAVDAIGSGESRAFAIGRAAPGAVVVHVGLAAPTGGVDSRKLTLQEIALVGSYTYTAEDFADNVRMMGNGDLGPLDWHEERPLSAGVEAFRDLLDGKVAAPKVVLVPGR